MSVARWFDTNERDCLLVIVLIGAALRALLVAYSPTPFGYVWDFYHEGVRILFNEHRLPIAEDCWQCAHPPLFYALGLPFYAIGRALDPGASDATALRWLGGLSLLSAGITVGYGYRLLTLCGFRGAPLILGFALLVVFPCLFISSYGPEADVVLAAVLSAFLFYLLRDFGLGSGSQIWPTLRLGGLAGLAAATKYSGLAALATAGVVIGWRILGERSRWRALVGAGLAIVVVAVSIGSWKYLDNYRRYGEPLHLNGSGDEGFRSNAARGRSRYDFTTFRASEIRLLVGPKPPDGQLSSFALQRSVITMLHGLAWSDLSMFSVTSRHGDPSRPYPRKVIPVGLTMSVIWLGFVPEVLALIGLATSVRDRFLWPMAAFCAIALGAYVWWFLPQEQWALKTKYVQFLFLPLMVYAMRGWTWTLHRAPLVGWMAGAGCVALIVLGFVYQFAFALGHL